MIQTIQVPVLYVWNANLVITVPENVDVLAPSGARPSADTMLTKK